MLPITVNGPLFGQHFSVLPQQALHQCYGLHPRHVNCQTINDILLIRETSGWDIQAGADGCFLTQITNASGSLAECTQFGDGSSVWGPVH
jgi:hypothetical protein